MSSILLDHSINDYSHMGDYSKILDWSQKHFDGPRPLHQQIARKPFSGPQVHDKRFEDTPVPEFSSRSEKLVGF